MNICIFIDLPLDAPGGTVRSVLNQKVVLEKAGHDVFIVCLGKKVVDDPRIHYARPYVRILKGNFDFAFLIKNIVTNRRIKTFLQANKIDVVHVQTESTTADVGILLAKQLNLPLIATVHNYYWPAPRIVQSIGGFFIEIQYLLLRRKRLISSKSGNNRLEKAVRGLTEEMCRRVDTVIAPSSHLKNDLMKYGLKTPIEVIPNPYIENQEIPSPEILTLAKLSRFVWIGRCVPEKRLIEFIDALQYLHSITTEKFEIIIIGDGPDFDKAHNRVKEYGLSEHVIFTGIISNDEAVSYIDSAAVLILTSYHFDNQPVVISEAVSRYRGVIYCDERLTEGVSTAGLLSEGPDPVSIAKTIENVIKNPSIAVELSKKAKRAAREFSGKTYSDKLLTAVNMIRRY